MPPTLRDSAGNWRCNFGTRVLFLAHSEHRHGDRRGRQLAIDVFASERKYQCIEARQQNCPIRSHSVCLSVNSSAGVTNIRRLANFQYRHLIVRLAWQKAMRDLLAEVPGPMPQMRHSSAWLPKL